MLVIPVDFSSGLHIYEEISRQLQTLDVGILGNKKIVEEWEGPGEAESA